jgi:NAD-dependent dihydropyrimidine dehydrogenase PreA subunit
MAYVIGDPCVGRMDASCVEVCPVDCIHPTQDEAEYESVEQLFIDPAADSGTVPPVSPNRLTFTSRARRATNPRPYPRLSPG